MKKGETRMPFLVSASDVARVEAARDHYAGQLEEASTGRDRIGALYNKAMVRMAIVLRNRIAQVVIGPVAESDAAVKSIKVNSVEQIILERGRFETELAAQPTEVIYSSEPGVI